jgi:hypothetical protein
MRSLICILVTSVCAAQHALGFPLSSIFHESEKTYIRGMSLRILEWLKKEDPDSLGALDSPELRRCLETLDSWDRRIDDLNAMPNIWFRVHSAPQQIKVREIGCGQQVFVLKNGKVSVERLHDLPESIALVKFPQLQSHQFLKPTFIQGKDTLHFFEKLTPVPGKDPEIVSQRLIFHSDKQVAVVEAPVQTNLFLLSLPLRVFAARYAHEFGLGIRMTYIDFIENTRDIIIP